MQAYCVQCKFDFDVPDTSAQRVKCIVCGQSCEVTDDAGVPIKRPANRKKKLSDGARRCTGCGKALARGVTYCVACGVHNYDAGKALGATLEKRVECERDDDEDEIVFWRLVRIVRRLLRIDSPAAPPPRGD